MGKARGKRQNFNKMQLQAFQICQFIYGLMCAYFLSKMLETAPSSRREPKSTTIQHFLVDSLNESFSWLLKK